MNRNSRAFLALLLMTAMLCFLPACSGSSGSADDEDTTVTEELSEEDIAEQELADRLENGSDLDNPVYANEQEGASYTEVKSTEDDFIGKWTAGSDKAAYLYGNIDLQIAKGGSWTGNITDENFKGTWEYNGTGITLNNEIFNADLFFTEDGTLNLRDQDSPDDIIVLTRAK